MSTNPLRENLNRAEQVKVTKQDLKQSVSLFDIDYAMMSYLEDTALPTLDDNGKALKIPVIYGNSERWKGAQRDGIFRDNKGRIQLPLMMIRRNSITKDESMPMLNRHVSYPTVTKYSKDNRYDRFSLMGTSVKPKYELYNITMPQYVEVSYQCMAWTSYTEHLNKVIEQLQFAGSFWGDKDKFKFKVSLSDFEVINEVGEGTERINRIEFSLAVKAYLLPERFDNESTIKKSISTKAFITTLETDMTGAASSTISTNDYNANKIIYDYLEINETKVANTIVDAFVTFNGVKVIQPPAELDLSVEDTIKVYINGVKYSKNYYTFSYPTPTILRIEFNEGLLGFPIETNDEIHIAGKFQLV